MQYQTKFQSPLGELQLISDGSALTHLLYPNQHIENVKTKGDLPLFQKVTQWLEQYFEGNHPVIDFTLAPHGSDFQREVWDELIKIAYGDLETYGNIAKSVGQKLGKPKMSAQAVGGAVGRNPISIIIPCHRVVGKDGSLTVYGGTIDNKIKLLEIENVDMSQLYRPKYSTKP